jgi:hypothetical protein
MKTITTKGTLLNGDGYREAEGVKVIDHGDTISIGRSEYPKDEVEITATEIVSKVACPPWRVMLNK